MTVAAINLPENAGLLELFSDDSKDDSLRTLSASDAGQFGEAPVQLIEGGRYEYQLPEGLVFEDLKGIVKPSKRAERHGRSEGQIAPGIFVGTLKLNILDKTTKQKSCSVTLEVRSVKASYRSDYRYMLEEIARQCTDLIMQHSSPVSQAFTKDYKADPATAYQRFAFVKSILDSNEFQESVHKIISSPVTTWAETDAEVDIRKVRRLKNSHLRQITSRSNRINLPMEHSLYGTVKSIPARITVEGKTETVDTPENRFVKHALETFLNFCMEIRKCLFKENGNMSRAYAEADTLSAKLEDILTHDIFKSVSPPQSIPLNSPVLQRKEGYREILRSWLMFDLAARLVWHGGEDVYSAGKRDVAILYEYWLFFKLLEIFGQLFSLDLDSISQLVMPTADGLGLKLKAGKHTPLKGIYDHPARKLNIEFSYNRTFPGNQAYPAEGSWSRQMRPDYTLSIWPVGFTQKEAEQQELTVHVHFDAKYRVESVSQIFGENTSTETTEDEVLNLEKEEQRKGTYKRADLLKMHAYKDAIRRTVGAYVLYPGNDEAVSMRGFHEIVPGLGAFAVRPSRVDDGSVCLKSFVGDVIDHLVNRASQHERMTYHKYKIHNSPRDEVWEQLPKCDLTNKRSAPPADISVLVGFVKDDTHFSWINYECLYDFRIDSSKGSTQLSPEAAGASFLLMHRKGELITGDIWRVVNNGPRIYSCAELARFGYPFQNGNKFLVYNIRKCTDEEFENTKWDLMKLPSYLTEHSRSMPFVISLVDFMKASINSAEDELL
jgi:predicted component of viral defense system (DUF524 family)